MTILFYDTETTGLPDYKASIDAPCQPYLVQLAGILCEDDGRVVSQLCMIVNSGVDIPTAAADIHGITTATAARLGSPVAVALAPFIHLWRTSDLVVAHNEKFDNFIIRTAIWRRWGVDRTLHERPRYCTMEASAPIVGLPASPRMIAAGMTGPKPPRLEEAYRHFFGEGLPGAHDALVDATACMRIYFKMQTAQTAQEAA